MFMAKYTFSVSQNKSTFRVVLSQTILNLTNCIMKSTSIYGTKQVYYENIFHGASK